jgi:hypothetical protein
MRDHGGALGELWKMLVVGVVDSKGGGRGKKKKNVVPMAKPQVP